MKIHFIGIGGRGMSRLAALALQMGYEVSGSDRVDKSVLQTLSSQGAKIYRAHSISNIQGIDLVIYSAGIAESNVEIIAAKNECIPVFSRSQGLAKLLRQNKQEVITVAGTYGKTTTTTLLATLLDFAGLDPTIYVGGKASSLIGGGTKLGYGKYAVVEADEYLGEFYHLDSAGSIITGIE